MALTFRSVGRAIGKGVKALAKPATVAGLTLINPALGGAAAKALALKGVVKKATTAIGQVLSIPSRGAAPNGVVQLAPTAPVLQMQQASSPAAVPETVGPMPYQTFRGIMWRVYQAGRNGEQYT